MKKKCVNFVTKTVLTKLHEDRDLAALLIPKLLKGCDRFMKMYEDI